MSAGKVLEFHTVYRTVYNDCTARSVSCSPCSRHCAGHNRWGHPTNYLSTNPELPRAPVVCEGVQCTFLALVGGAKSLSTGEQDVCQSNSAKVESVSQSQ